MIAIIDYDIGNVGAVSNMLKRLGRPNQITADPAVIAAAEGIILPGNGAFDACMQNLRASGLLPLLEERVLRQGVPLLGICVGAQMLALSSEEGNEPGLGWIRMHVRRFPPIPELRVPHMGWNYVKKGSHAHPLTNEVDEATRFYFVHSYYLEAEDPGDVILSCHYGVEFAAAVARGNIAGVQFHPEKSHRFGKNLLKHFGELAG